MNPDTIRLDLHHYADSEFPSYTLQANSEIKNILMMDKKGFKWKTLINDQSGRRYQVMQMNKPKDLEIILDDNCYQRSEPLIVKAA